MVASFSLFVSRLDEETTHFSAIADLLKKETDASIFRNIGLKYAVRYKTEFSNTGPVHELSSSPRLKPTMGEILGFNPEMLQMVKTRINYKINYCRGC